MRPIGEAVKVADPKERYRGTKGVVCGYEHAFGTTMYRVRADLVKDYGVVTKRPGWECLFFPDQLRKLPSNDHS